MASPLTTPASCGVQSDRGAEGPVPTMTTMLSGTGESLHDAPGPTPGQRAVITPVAIVRLSGLRGRVGGELAMGRSGGHH